MLTFHGGSRIFVYQAPVDLRKGFEGLSAFVEGVLKKDVVSDNAYFVFLNRIRDRMKILYWDGDGLAIWYKRLEKGRFPKKKDSTPLMSRRAFLMLLEGVVPLKFYRRYKVNF